MAGKLNAPKSLKQGHVSRSTVRRIFISWTYEQMGKELQHMVEGLYMHLTAWQKQGEGLEEGES